jgi:hydroxymethylglutaryl-CoA lyase
MRDTADVLRKLNLDRTQSKLLAIIANKRGAEDAVQFEEISYLGYPFSISETFQQRNTNASIEESLKRVEEINELVKKNNKKLVLYLSMGFGNPYGDEWSPEIVIKWSERLKDLFNVEVLALSDTIGSSEPKMIQELFSTLIPALPDIEFGAHLHTTPQTAYEKIASAYYSGCRRFDGAIKGFGGCPMAKDDLTGNMPTEVMIEWFNENNIPTNIEANSFSKALDYALKVFPT